MDEPRNGEAVSTPGQAQSNDTRREQVVMSTVHESGEKWQNTRQEDEDSGFVLGYN